MDLGPVALFAGFSVFWISDTIADPDLWGHIRFGQDILRSGSIVQADTDSYRTGVQIWTNHEWLSEVIFAKLYNRWGPVGLVVAKLSVGLLVLGLCRSHLRRRGLGPYRTLLLLILIAVPFRLGLGTVRPQIFTYLFFLVELLVLERATTATGIWLCTLPVLFAAWINLHGGVLAGVFLLGIWIAVRIVALTWESPRQHAANFALVLHFGLVGLCLRSGVLLCNPYGAELVRLPAPHRALRCPGQRLASGFRSRF